MSVCIYAFGKMQLIIATFYICFEIIHSKPIEFLTQSPWPYGSQYKSEGTCRYDLSVMHGAGTWKINVTTSLSATLIVRYIGLVIHTKRNIKYHTVTKFNRKIVEIEAESAFLTFIYINDRSSPSTSRKKYIIT